MDWLLAAALAAAVIVGAAGIDMEIGGFPVRSHSAVRVLAVALVIFAVRLRMGIAEWAGWLLRMTLITCIAFGVATWFRFLLTTIGGADSYGYVSATDMLLKGRLVEPAPIAEWLSAPNRLALASPLGWAPAPDGSGVVPKYPLGLPILMATFTAIGGAGAAFLVSPILAILTLVLVYRLARESFDSDVALVTCAVLAWNPVFVAYAKQPMSDVAASAFLMLGVALAFRSAPMTSFLGGLAAGFAVMIRPALLVAAAVVPLLTSIRLKPDTTGSESPDTTRSGILVVSAFRRIDRKFLLAAAGLGVGVAAQAALQTHLFGSPFATGYGAAENLFSTAHVAPNLWVYSRQTWIALSGMWVTCLVAGALSAGAQATSPLLAIAATVTLPYLFYLPFDHWETLRFLLPALVPLSILAGAGLVRIARGIPAPAIAAALVILFTTGLVVRNATFLRDQSAWNIQELEARYPLAGQWLRVNTPPASVALAHQHSGSLRWYGGRQTVRWDLLAPEQLTATVRDLESHGAAVYVALEGAEVEMFDSRFAGVVHELRVDHVGRVRNVHFRRLATSRAGSPAPGSSSP